MKIKNMKMMLLGLIGLMSGVSAYAESPAFPVTAQGDKVTKDGVTYTVKAETDVKKDETGRSVNNIVYNLYTIKWTAVTGTASFETKEAYVTGVNSTAANTAVATLTIPATVTGDLGTYNVVGIADNWATALKSVIDVTTTLSVDITNLKTAPVDASADPIVMKTEQLLPNLIYKDFAILQSLTITDSYAATATAPARYTQFAGVFADGTKATLTTANLSGSNITSIGENAFKDCTALTGFDFGTKITTIGPSAFNGCFGISELTIPVTVTSIGENAFANMYKAAEGTTPAKGLKTLIINGANNTYTTAGALASSTIPAAFSGDVLIESITIGSKTATGIAESAFASTTALKVIDLSGAEKLATIGEGAFPAKPALTSVKLYGSDLDNDNFANIDFSGANRTLATLTLPAKLSEFPAVTAPRLGFFHNFIALAELDLSVTKVTAIPNSFFQWTTTSTDGISTVELDATGKPVKGKYIAPALTTVKLNAENASIGANAFKGCSKLATVENLNNAKLEAIGESAFNGTTLPTLDLSATKVAEIPAFAFGNIATLTSIKLPATVAAIATAAFAYDAKVTSINLEDLKKLEVLNPIFHEGIAGEYTAEIEIDGDLTTVTVKGAEEVAIPLTTVTLPADGKLTTIAPGALQLLDITEIDIPATVRSIGAYALQGCIKLESFTWNEAQQREIANNTFNGDDHLKVVKMVTVSPADEYAGIAIVDYNGDKTVDNPIDLIFKGNDKNVLKFIVNAEDEAALIGMGWSESNLQFCTLTSEGASEYEFKAAGKSGEFYYATYYNEDQATWFPADKFEVFSAVVEGANVVLKPASVENGYYKVEKFTDYYYGTWNNGAVCVIRSKDQKAAYELKNASFNEINTMPTDNDLLVAQDEFTVSRLKYQYKFGSKNGVVAFYRVTSGKIKAGGVYIQSETAADRLNIVFEGDAEATAIKSIAAEAEKNGAVYNLNGVRVNKASKGVYIQNGKKYVK